MKNVQLVKLFSMLQGYKPITNLLGAGDPNVHKIDDQWWMFFGGFQKNFKNNLFSASLPAGEPLTSGMKWTIITDPNHPGKALPLIAQPDKKEWDHYGLHEPCFVNGMQKDDKGEWVPCRRIYYTGRSSRKVQGNETPFSIGFLEKTTRGWERHPTPVITGTSKNPSALGPKVIFEEGRWRIWYRATPREPAKGEEPQVEIYYSESEDGISNWSQPELFFTRKDLIAHAYPLKTTTGYEMLVSTSPNLYGDSFYPPPNLWLLRSAQLSGRRKDWTEQPIPLLGTDQVEAWYQGGFFGSSLCEADSIAEKGSRYIFFTGVHKPIRWLTYSMKRLTSFRKPPVPAPFYFTIGFFKFDSVLLKQMN